MINYYLRPGNVFVKIDHTTYEIVNVLNSTTKQSVSKLNKKDYYDLIVSELSGWTESNETAFTDIKSEVLTLLNN